MPVSFLEQMSALPKFENVCSSAQRAHNRQVTHRGRWLLITNLLPSSGTIRQCYWHGPPP